MRVGKMLDELRSRIPDCRLAAFVDLDAELVLAASAEDKPRQETLDSLAEIASGLLSFTLGKPGTPGLNQAVFWTANDTIAVVRSSAEPSEVVCCKCATGSDVKTVLASAHVAVNWIGKSA